PASLILRAALRVTGTVTRDARPSGPSCASRRPDRECARELPARFAHDDAEVDRVQRGRLDRQRPLFPGPLSRAIAAPPASALQGRSRPPARFPLLRRGLRSHTAGGRARQTTYGQGFREMDVVRLIPPPAR